MLTETRVKDMILGAIAQKLAKDWPRIKRKSRRETDRRLGLWTAKLLGWDPRTPGVRKLLEPPESDSKDS